MFLGVPSGGTERQILAELAIFREVQKGEDFGKIVYISPKYELCQYRFQNWNKRIGADGLGLNVEVLSQDFSGQMQGDLDALSRGDVIISTPEKWDQITRKWRARKQILDISLYIFDEVHLLGEPHCDASYEVVMGRVKTIQRELRANQQSPKSVRIIAMGSPISNSKDICTWLSIDHKQSCFNFHPSTRSSCPSLGPLSLTLMSFDHLTRSHRLLQMTKPIYNLVKRHLSASRASQAIVFTSDRAQT